jgi:hypothetical protein
MAGAMGKKESKDSAKDVKLIDTSQDAKKDTSKDASKEPSKDSAKEPLKKDLLQESLS